MRSNILFCHARSPQKRLSDSNGVILAVKELRLIPQGVLVSEKTFV